MLHVSASVARMERIKIVPKIILDNYLRRRLIGIKTGRPIDYFPIN
jgi:hypothetical protein